MACVMENSPLDELTVNGNAWAGSGLDDDVAVLDVDQKGFGYIRTLLQLLAAFDGDRIRTHFHALRIEPGLPVAHVELPAVPWTPQQFADPRAHIDARLG